MEKFDDVGSNSGSGAEAHIDDDTPLLWWVGGPAPIGDERFHNMHEMVTGGGVRCRCGEVHTAPGPGRFIVHAGAVENTASVVVTGHAPGPSILAPTTTPSSTPSQPRVVHGLVDPRAWTAFAQLITPPAGCAINCSPNELGDMLLAATTFELQTREYATTHDAIVDAPLLAATFEKRLAALLSMNVPASTRLHEINKIATAFQSSSENLLLQVSTDEHAKVSVTLLISRDE